jgi:hypothetical protein
MPRQPTGNPNGRPKKEVTLAQVEKLFAIGCTQQEVADFFGVSVDTLSRRLGFADVQARGKAKSKVSLRRAQFKSALAGNSRLLTWLGMQMLGQTNVTKAEITNTPPPVDLSKLTDEELDAYERLYAKISQPGDSGEST